MLSSLLVALVHLTAAVEEAQTQADEKCPPCETEDDKASPWTAAVGLGFVWMTGNSDMLNLTGNGVAEYTSETWLITLQADAALEKAKADGEDDSLTISEAYGGWGRGEYRLTRLFSLYGLLGADTDHLASRELRFESEAGVGLTFFERERDEEEYLFLEFHLGWHFARDYRFQYFPNRRQIANLNFWGPAANVTLRYQLNEHLQLREYANIMPNVVGDSRWLFDSTTVLAAGITDRLALTLYFIVETDTAPPPDVVDTDTSLSFGLEFLL